MLIKILRHWLKSYSYRTGRHTTLYRKLGKPNNVEWGAYLARWGGLYQCGELVSVNLGCNIVDPAYVQLGSNITLSDCTLIGHDGVIEVLSRRYGKQLDSVGKIEIRDNCFVGHGAIVMPRVAIGPDSVVAAGAVVTKDVPPGMVVGGNPAKVICSTEQLLQRIEERSNSYPWIDLIRSREGSFDPLIEPQLKRMRVAYFYGDETPPDHVAVPAHD